MNSNQSATAHSLYTLYETLPNDVQQAFLQELLQKRHEQQVELAVAVVVMKFYWMRLLTMTTLPRQH